MGVAVGVAAGVVISCKLEAFPASIYKYSYIICMHTCIYHMALRFDRGKFLC